MSNSMLEQAIIDASQLREAALKSAETAVIEKYSTEVEQAMQNILEQDDEEMGFGMDDDLDANAEDGVELDIPMAHDPSVEGDDVVVVDLDQIIAAAESEDDSEEEDFELDRQEIADEVGLDVSLGDEVVPGNRGDDEIDVDEADLVDLFKEILTVDIPEEDQEMVAEYDEEEVAEAEEEAGVFVATPAEDGVAKEDLESLEYKSDRLEMKNEELVKENKDLKSILVKVKNRLEEINLSNARLLYTNRVLQDSSLNEQQKNKIVEMVTGAQSVKEAELIFEALQKTMAGNSSKKAPQSLSEVVSRKSSVILSGRRESETPDSGKPVLNRWATLAGINNK
jgi:hypothetical protein